MLPKIYTARKLLFSDDLVIVVENDDGLQKAIDGVRRSSGNTEKTRVLWIMAHYREELNIKLEGKQPLFQTENGACLL